ncbi:hypothetical protein P885DRAFT_71594 [Corynascus similis CBS 632.67]
MGDEVQKARALANTVTLNRLMSKLKSDPSANLASALKHQAEAYLQLRARLEQVALDKATGQGSDSDSDGGNNGEGRRNGEADSSTRLATRVNETIRNGEVLWRLHGTVVLGLSAFEVLKIGTSLDPDEIANLRYIKNHVSNVPAPSFLGCLKSGRKTYVFMSRADGVTLGTVWPDLSAQHKASIKTQLTGIFQALRNNTQLPPPPGDNTRFGGFTSGICKDMRRQLRVSTATIRSEAQFNDFLCHKPGRPVVPWITMIRSGMRDDRRLVMTHGDLHPRNIMVRWEPDREESDAPSKGTECKRIRITALIDWELSGWYPEYWEFVKALSTINPRGKLVDWFEYLPTEAIGCCVSDCYFEYRWAG